MGVNIKRQRVSYGLNQPTISVPYAPILSTRVPTAADLAPKGTMWVTTSTNAVYVLTSITGGDATWTTVS